MRKKKTKVISIRIPSGINIPFTLAAFSLGVLTTLCISHALAQVVNNTIFACVNTATGNVRIVTATTSCRSNETSLTWNQQGIQGPPGPTGTPGTGSPLGITCTFCHLSAYADRLRGKDLTDSVLFQSDFFNVDLSGIILKGSQLEVDNFTQVNLTNADFSNLQFLDNTGFISSTMTNTNFSNSTISSSTAFDNSDLTGANFSNVQFGGGRFTGANLQNAKFTNSIMNGVTFSGALNASTADFTGVTWVPGTGNTCADGTNPDNNGGTCAGHM